MSWHNGKIFGLDLETTAPDPEDARIVTACVVVIEPGSQPRSHTWLADPGVEIPEQASEIHGVTTERAKADGAPVFEVIFEVIEMLAMRQPGEPLVIFNARYDLTVLDREARRRGIPPLQTLGPLQVVDPLVLDKHLDRYRSGKRQLEPMCQHYGVTLDGAHDAAFDALAACRLAWKMGAKGEIVRRAPQSQDEAQEVEGLKSEWSVCRGDLDALHMAQVDWAAFQARGLAEHFRKKGDPAAATVRTDWPLVPLEAPASTSGPQDPQLLPDRAA